MRGKDHRTTTDTPPKDGHGRQDSSIQKTLNSEVPLPIFCENLKWHFCFCTIIQRNVGGLSVVLYKVPDKLRVAEVDGAGVVLRS